MSQFDILFEQFPEHRQLIARRLRTQPEFREMCEDFVDVYAMLGALRALPRRVDERFLTDYDRLLIEISAEIMRELHDPVHGFSDSAFGRGYRTESA